jgi:hypothetical protein
MPRQNLSIEPALQIEKKAKAGLIYLLSGTLSLRVEWLWKQFAGA